jgi:hypothetical protein
MAERTNTTEARLRIPVGAVIKISIDGERVLEWAGDADEIGRLRNRLLERLKSPEKIVQWAAGSVGFWHHHGEFLSGARFLSDDPDAQFERETLVFLVLNAPLTDETTLGSKVADYAAHAIIDVDLESVSPGEVGVKGRVTGPAQRDN